jgi:gliding motility-associated-like protein
MIARFSNLKFKSIGILLLFLASTFVSFSQLDATFTSPDPTQCPSNLFTINANTTTYTTYTWLVTGPSGFSQSPSGSSIALYLTAAGPYTVKLTVDNGVTTNSNTVTNYLTVYDVPVISYTLSAITGCSPLTVAFNGSCTAGSGTLSSFSANSGDGSNYTTEDFSHTFNSAGTFTPSVSVTNSFGCITTGNLSAVTVKQSPSLTSPTNPNSVCSGSVFSYTPTATPTGCTFTWTRAAVAGISQAASSGSGNISETLTNTTGSNINVVYVVTITGTNGCVKTQNVTVSVRALPTVTISPASVSICSGQTTTLTATGSATGGTYTWSPGGATTSTRTVTTTPGTYSVVYSDGTCASASVSRIVSLATAPTVTIGVTESSVTANDGTVCSGSNVVLTANPSTAGGTYAWSTGATSSSITVASTVTTAYTLTYTYVCASSPASATITVNKNPVPAYTSSNSNVCTSPATTVYTSTATAGQGTITATSWSFPSGSPNSSTSTTPSITYNSSGNFSISQTITNSVGCTATTTFPNAMVVGNGTPPTSSFTSLKPLTQCVDVDSVKFKYTGTGADTIKVDWNDGLTQYFDNLVSFSHKYATCGTFTVTLTPYKTVGGVLGVLGCAGSPTTYTVTIKGPHASFTASTINCSNQLSRTFTSTACGTGALTIQWQVTNTSPVYSATSTSATFPQTFPSTSSSPYKVVLTATDPSTGCSVSKDSLNVYALPNNLADFRAYTTNNAVEVVDVCIEGNLNFINTTPAPQYNPNNSGTSTNTRWDWKENDGLQWPSAPGTSLRGTPKNNIFSTLPNAAAVSYTPGSYGIAMVNIDLNGCRDTVVKTNYIKVHGINGTFSVADTVCANTLITVTDNSVAPVGSIVSRVWSWGDGTANTTGNVANPTHTYTSTGIKVITLTATDDFGCTKTSTDTILVRKPLSSFSVDRNYVCNNQTVTVTNASSGIGTLTYAWLTTGATPVTSTLQSPGVFTFTSTGSKTIKLTVTETSGCSDDTTLTITVNDPFPNSVATPNFASCFNPPTVVNFTNTSSNNVDNTSAQWNFGNGQTSTNWNPSTVYSLPGTYVVSLTVSSLTGCSATRNVDTVTIGGPFGSITVNNANLTGCSCYAASITVTTSAVTEAKLLYGDGQFLVLTPNTTQTVNYSYCNTGGTTVTMNPSLYISNGTCNGFIPASQTINIKPTPTVTAIPNQVKCAGTNSDAVVFTGNVTGATYTWSHTNSTIGLAIPSPAATGNIASFVTTNTTLSGVVSTFTVTPSYNGCTGTARTFTITVGPRPVVSISSGSVCVGGAVTVTPATAANGSWSGNNNSVATISAAGTIAVQPGSGGNVVFTYTETISGCTNTVNLTVNPKPTVTGASGVCVGSTITLSPTTGGTWISNAPTIATVGASTGVVTGVSTNAPSCATFTFTNSTTGCANTTTCIPVNPLPTVTLTPSTVCQGTGATATPSTLGTWVSSNTGVAQITNAGVITTPTVIASQSTATFTYTLTSTGCSKTTSALTVNPLPVLTAPASVCIGTPGALTPTTGGTWTSSNTSVATVTNAGVITGVAAGTVTFTFVQTGTLCSATTASVSINATPVITNMTTTVCSGTAFSVTPVNGTNGTIPTGTTYTWSAPTATGITGTAAGTAATLISGTLTNTTSSTKTVAYTVTPTLGSCAGTPFTVTVTVNPKPSVAAKTATICSTNAFTVSPTDGSGSDIVPTGTTYTWTVTANNNVTGESAQATAQTNISQTLTGNTSVQTVNYTVTPTSGTCLGSTFPLTVTVNPIPTFTAAKTDPTSCGATNGTITLSGLTATTSYQVTYVVLGVPTSTPRITDATGKIIISSLSAGSYTVSVTLTSSGCQSATQVVTLTNPGAPDINDITDQVLCGGSYTLPTITGTNLPGNQAYYTAPSGGGTVLTGSISTSQTVYIYGISSGGCSDQESFTVTINTPAAIPAKTATICSGGTFTVTPVNGGAEVVPAGTTYTWSAPVVVGVNGLASGTAASNISGTLVNTTNVVKTVVYTVTPTSGTCSGAAFTVTVTLNPLPAVTDMTATACSATAFSVTPANTTNGIVPTGTTYTWAAPTTTTTGGSAQATGQTAISQTLTNSTTTSTTATYTVTPTFTTCVGATFQLVVTVNPTPVITNKSATICSGATFTTSPTTGSGNIVPTGTTYSWSAPVVTGITGTLSGTGAANISGTLVNTTNAFINVVYVVTPTVGTCSGATFNVTVRVNPTPAVTAITASACSGNAFSVTPANTTNGIVPSGTTYTWAAPVVTDITGTAAGTNAALITGTLTNSTSSSINVPYTITPKSGTCTGTDFTLTVTVNPNPAINAMTATVCSGTAFTVTPTDVTNGLVPAGTTYTWAAPTATGITGGAAGTGATNINGTLVNTTSTAKTIVYTVTPGLGTCSGAPFTVTVTVNPAPSIAAKTATICSTGTFTTSPTNGTGGDIVPTGTTYTWTVVSSPVTGESAQATAQTNISQTLTTASLQTVNYTVTPTSGTCVGSTFALAVTVNPLPTFTATKTDPTTCNGTNGFITLSGLTPNVSYQYTYDLLGVTTGPVTATPGAGGTLTISNLGAGTYTVFVKLVSTGCQSATQQVTLSNPGAPDITDILDQNLCGGSYTLPAITGTNLPGNQAYYTLPNGGGSVLTGSISTTQTIYIYGTTSGGCSDQESFTVTINTVPSIAAKTATICSNGTFTVSPTNTLPDVIPTGTTYSWSAPVVSGITGTVAGSAATNISGTLVNTTNAPINVVYSVTPTANSCPGTPFNVTVTVNPQPAINDMTATACNATAFNVTPANTTNGIVPTGTTYVWSAPTTTATGGSAQATAQTSISQTLTHTSASAVTASYTVTPTSGTCVGNPFTLVVTVSPRPVISNETTTICSAGNFAVTPASGGSNVIPTGTTYTWTAPTVTDITGTTSGSGLTSIGGTLTNLSNAPINVTYVVTPMVGVCAGATFNVTVTVEPKPAITPMLVAICTDNSFSITPVNTTNGIVPAGTTYTWAAPTVTNIAGTTSGTNSSSITGTLSNPTNAAINVVYTITPTSGTCVGTDFPLTVTVNPIPAVADMTASASTGVAFSVSPANTTNGVVPSGTTYTWAVPPTPVGISGTTSGTSAPTINGTLVNNTSSAIDVVYTVTPVIGNCTGAPFSLTVTVYPRPTITAKTATICSGETFTISPIDGVGGDIVPAGTTYTWTVTNNPNVSGDVNQTNPQSNISQTLICGATTQVVNYVVTPTAGTIVGNSFTLAVTVNPIPTFTTTKTDPTACNGTDGTITLNSLTANTSYNYSIQGIVLPFTTNTATTNASGQIIISGLGADTYTIAVSSPITNCESTPRTVTLNNPGAPNVNDITDVLVCGTSYTLPTITGTNLPATGIGTLGFFSAPNGVGQLTGTLTSAVANTQTIYIYAATPGGCSDQESFILTINPSPVVTAAAAVCVNETITLTTTSTGTWVSSNSTFASVDPNTGIVTGHTAGTVTFTFTESGTGCQSTTTSVTVKALPTVTAGPNQTICSNSSVTLAGVLGGSATAGVWSGGAGTFAPDNTAVNASYTPSPTEILANTVTLTINTVDPAGICSSISSNVTITIDQLPTINAGLDQTICSSSTATLGGTLGGSATTATWSSSGTPNTVSPSNSLNATYTPSPTDLGPIVLTLTSNDPAGPCPAVTSTVTITVNPKATVNAGVDFPSCNGLPIQMAGTTGGSATGGTWSTAGNTGVYAPNTATGVYTPSASEFANPFLDLILTTDDPIGPCPAVSDIVRVTFATPATANAGPDQTICSGLPVNVTGSFGGSASSATWVNFGGTMSPSINISPITYTYTPSPSEITNHLAVLVVKTDDPAGPCPFVTDTALIQINPTPFLLASNQFSSCTGTSVNIPLVVAGGLTSSYVWTVSDNPNILGESVGQQSSDTITDVLVNLDPVANQSVIYHVTPTIGSCVGTPVDITVTVLPRPIMNPVADQLLCATTPTQPVIFTSNIPTTNYDWVNSNATIGLAATGLGNIASFTATNNSGVTQVAIIDVKPRTFLGSTNCYGDSVRFHFTVLPISTVNDPVDQVICSGQSTAAVIFTGSDPLTVYNWTATNTSTGISASGTGNIPSFIGTTGFTPTTSTVTVTPSLNGCLGTPQTFTITVKPVPVMNTITDKILCIGNVSNIIPFTSQPVGTTYGWTNDNIAIGLGASGTTNFIPSFTATHSTGSNVNDVDTANIHIIPDFGGCAGTPIDFIIYVNPILQADPIPNAVLCEGDPFPTITITGNAPNVIYTWSNNNTAIGLPANGSTLINGFTVQAGVVTETALITITPNLSGCQGIPSTFTITVKPKPNVYISQVTQGNCHNVMTIPVNFTSDVVGTTYIWTNTDNMSIQTGTQYGGVSTSFGNLLSFPGQNTFQPFSSQTARYIVVPTVNGCVGDTGEFTITVDPKPTVNSEVDQTICAGQPTVPITFTGNLPAGTVYNWDSNAQSIFPNTWTFPGTSSIPSFIANNTSSVTVHAPVIVTPVYGFCTGVSDTLFFHVKPKPTVNQIPNQSLCVNSMTQAVNFSGNMDLNPSDGPATYNWENSEITIGLAASGSGNIIPFPAGNNGNSIDSAEITVVPTINQCFGDTMTFFITTVDPIPIVNQVPDQVWCEGQATNSVIFVNPNSASYPLTNFVWTNDNPIGIASTSTANAANGFGLASFVTDINNSITPVVSTFSVVPEYSGCYGDTMSFTITVKAVPNVYITPQIQQACAGLSTQVVAFTGNVANTVFDWVATAANVGSGPSGTGNVASFTAVNNTTNIIHDTIYVTPSFNGCIGDVDTAIISVNPTTTVVLPPTNYSYCHGDSIPQICFVGNNPATTYLWSNGNTAIGLPGTGSGCISTFNGINTGLANDTATIIVQPTLNGCLGIPDTFNIVVKPIPTLFPTPDQNLCATTSTTQIVFQGNMTSTTTFTWSGNNSSIGLSPNSGTNSIPSFVTDNLTQSIQIDSIIPIPERQGCIGIADTFLIVVNPIAIATVNDITVCSGDTVPFTTIFGSTSAADYTWNHNYPNNITLANTGTTSGVTDTIPSFVATNNGTTILIIPIVVTPVVNGCPGINDTLYLTINPTPTVDPVTSQTWCHNQTTNQVVFTGTVANTTFDWTNSNAAIGISGPGQNILPVFTPTNTDNPLAPRVGTITVTPTANGCSGVPFSFTITVNPLPIINAGFDTTLCLGQFVVPQGSGQGLGGGPSYAWTANPSTAVTPVNGTAYYPDASTWLTVIGTDGNLCQNIDSFHVNYLQLPPPIVNAGIDTAICFGESITLCATGNASVYVWDSGVFDCQSFIPDTTADYIVTGSSVTTGCYTKDTIQVIVNPLPIVVANASLNPVCAGQTTILYGTGADVYVWDNSVIDSVGFVPTATNTYEVIGTDIHGCKDTADIVVTVNPMPNVLFSSNMTYGGCLPFAPEFTDLTSPPSAQVTWLFGNGAVSNTPGTVTNFYDSYGCYDVTLISTTAEGCTDSLTQQDFVCVNQIIADFDPDTFEQPISNPQFEFTNTSQNATSFEWFFGDGTGNDFVHTNHNYDSTGYYVVTLVASAQDGCTDTARITIKVRDEVILYVPNTFTPDENGLNDVFMPTLTAGYDREGVYEFRIYNRWGEQLFFTNQLFTGWDGTYKGEKVQIGTYNWSLRFKDSQNNKVYDFYGHVNLIR